MKIKTIGWALVVVLAVTGIIQVTSVLSIRSDVESINKSWHDFRVVNSDKARLINELTDAIGYGGLIHQFKNYVLRQEEKQLNAVRIAVNEANRIIDAYQAFEVTETEVKALQAIKVTVTDYMNAAVKTEELTYDALPPEEIDAKVKIDDAPALAGFAALRDEAMFDESQGESLKVFVLNQMRKNFGYGGMIHQFKNYVIRRDEGRITKVEQKLAELKEDISRYRTFGINEKETEVLKNIEGVIDAYGSGLKLAIDLAKDGASASDIDSQVKVSDKPALNGFVELTREVNREIEGLTARVNDSVVTVENLVSTIVVVTGVLLSAIVALSIWAIQGRVVAPLRKMTDAMGALAKGELETEVPAQGQDNEIGEMAQAVQVFKDNALEVRRLEQDQEASRLRAEEEKTALMNKMADDFQTGVGEIVEAVSAAATEMQTSAHSLTDSARHASDQATNVAAAAEEASVNVQTVSSAAEQLSSSITEISRQVSRSTEISTGAVAEAEKTNETVLSLAEASQKIGDVVALITDIAEQTNLLALNATIEAARAGEAGKGFAVVASEVKNLANQTARATDEISSQIGGIQSVTDEAVTAIQSIAQTIGEINQIGGSIAAAIEEQGAATQEIARNVEEASNGTREVTQSIVKVTEAAGITGDAAGLILGASDNLSGHSKSLNEQVNGFLGRIRES